MSVSMAHFLIGLAVRFLLQCFLCVRFLRLTLLETDKSDESDEEEYEKLNLDWNQGQLERLVLY